MKAIIQKWGNSLAVRIPKVFADEVGLDAKSPVELQVIDGRIVLIPVSEEIYELEDLLDQITDNNLHGEIDTGQPMGNESW